MTYRRLLGAEPAVVLEPKLTAYLLSEAHPDGRGKARFFAHGFSAAAWQARATDLRNHATVNVVVEATETAFGERYVIEGILHTPDGRTPEVRAVWGSWNDENAPRLVTASPIERRQR